MPMLTAVKMGETLGEAVWAEGRRWYCWIGEFSEHSAPIKAAAVRTKRQAVRWLLANCPDAAINETRHQWRRQPAGDATTNF
jgi:hypothetical protein